MTKELKIIKTDGAMYLGNIDAENNKITDAVKIDKSEQHNAFKESAKTWFTKNNLGLLETIQLSSQQGYSIVDLTEQHKVNLTVMEGIMKDAKKLSLQEIENSYFIKHLNNF